MQCSDLAINLTGLRQAIAGVSLYLRSLECSIYHHEMLYASK